jgi:catechol 2,3-dioxygenase-like lactoylglutathione lyase family enzyme
MKLEVVVLPVTDVDRATEFYAGMGWRQDITPPGAGVVQFTPPGSAASVHFGADLTTALPGSAKGYLVSLISRLPNVSWSMPAST